MTDLESIAGEWAELAERVEASPFLRPGWVMPWLAAFGCGTPEAIVVRCEGQLAGVLPMQRRGRRLYSAANWHSPVFGPVVAGEPARALLLQHLFARGRHSVELTLLDGDGSWIAESARDAGRLVVDRTIASNPVIPLAGSFEAYESALSRNRRRSLRRGLRALEARGDVSFDVHEGAAGLDRAMAELFEVEASGWKGRAGTAMASLPETERFYAEVARWAAANGWLRLSFLRLDGRPIACDLSIEFGGTAYSLKSGYDEAYGAVGPGALLLREQVRDCFDRGLHALDLLGHVDPFKLSWTDQAGARMRVETFGRTPVGLLHWSRVATREGVRPAVSWIRGRLRDANARAHRALGSLAAQWEVVGLESAPGLL